MNVAFLHGGGERDTEPQPQRFDVRRPGHHNDGTAHATAVVMIFLTVLRSAAAPIAHTLMCQAGVPTHPAASIASTWSSA